MCQASFDRAIISAKQFIKNGSPEMAQEWLHYAMKYSDNPIHMVIISDVEKEISKVLTSRS